MWTSRLLPIALLALAAACIPGAEATGPAAPASPGIAATVAPKPAFPILGAALPAGHTRFDNASLARLFTVMTHELEGGTRRPHLVRYEVPVSIGLEDAAAERFGVFLEEYLEQLRHHTGIAIARGPAPYNLHVRFVDGRRFAATLPAAVCVIAGGDLGWDEFAADPLAAGVRDIALAERIAQMTIFIPDDARPHLVRNCLLEEVPQALGMSNDLYGLGMSSFNDDAAHLWPTKLDYLMLRVLYAPEMVTGLDRRETERRALAILDRINPQGRSAPPLPRLNRRALDEWSVLMERVFARGASEKEQREDVERALVLVAAHAPESPQHCHTLITAGRVLSRSDPERALKLFDAARRVCDSAHGVSDIRHARIDLDTVCPLLRLGRDDEVIAVAESIWPVLAAHGQDERLAALFTMQRRALAAVQGQGARAQEVARLAAEWNAYAVGPGREAAACQRRARNRV